MTLDEAFYQRANRRLDGLAVLIGAVAIVALGFLQGGRGALGCAIGAILSILNLHLWKRLATSIGSSASSGKPSRAAAVLLGLRYLILGSILFVIIKFFGVTLISVLAGLFVSVAAVIVEIVFELISHKS